LSLVDYITQPKPKPTCLRIKRKGIARERAFRKARVAWPRDNWGTLHLLEKQSLAERLIKRNLKVTVGACVEKKNERAFA